MTPIEGPLQDAAVAEAFVKFIARHADATIVFVTSDPLLPTDHVRIYGDKIDVCQSLFDDLNECLSELGFETHGNLCELN